MFDNAALSDLNMSPLQLQQALQARNIILPGGDLQTAYEKIVFEPTGNFNSVDELRKTLIDLPNSNSLVRIEDVLNIERGYVDPPATMARYNGEPALIIAISLEEGGNIIDLGEDITPEKRTELMGKLRNYVDDLQTGKRKTIEQTPA